MQKRSFLILILIVCAFGAITLFVYLSTAQRGTTLEFRIQDRLSKGWVWNATMILQNRTIKGFFQKDGGLREQTRIMIVGAVINETIREQMGADYYGRNAIEAVTIAKRVYGID